MHQYLYFDGSVFYYSSLPFQLRMDRHHSSALRVARFLSRHRLVSRVVHPLLPSHQDHDLAHDQHRGRHCGLFTFFHAGGGDETRQGDDRQTTVPDRALTLNFREKQP